MDWSELAVCRSMDPLMFFPTRGGSYAEARKACGRCPVRSACLSEALRLEKGLAATWRSGLWGGRTPEERKALDGTSRRVAA